LTFRGLTRVTRESDTRSSCRSRHETGRLQSGDGRAARSHGGFLREVEPAAQPRPSGPRVGVVDRIGVFRDVRRLSGRYEVNATALVPYGYVLSARSTAREPVAL